MIGSRDGCRELAERILGLLVTRNDITSGILA